MIDNTPVFEDAFNMLCGDLLGFGIHRDVYKCKIAPHLVVKVERVTESLYRPFSNWQEYQFWAENEHRPAVRDWLAPIEFVSPDARVMLQRRVDPIRDSDTLPDKLPSFLSDIKRENFGMLNGRLVCVDYAGYIMNVSTRLRKVNWV